MIVSYRCLRCVTVVFILSRLRNNIPKRDDRSMKTTRLGRPRTQRPGYSACQVSNQEGCSDLESKWKNDTQTVWRSLVWRVWTSPRAGMDCGVRIRTFGALNSLHVRSPLIFTIEQRRDELGDFVEIITIVLAIYGP